MSSISQKVFDFAETMIDNEVPQDEFRQMQELAEEVEHRLISANPICRTLSYFFLDPSVYQNGQMIYEHGYNIAETTYGFVLMMDCNPNLQMDQKRDCSLIRDIFGNPFRPVTFDPNWKTPTVTTLAQSMYEDRDFTAMPILGDALEEAGCDNDDILQHCRDKTGHVRGCWLVDLVLGKQ